LHCANLGFTGLISRYEVSSAALDYGAPPGATETLKLGCERKWLRHIPRHTWKPQPRQAVENSSLLGSEWGTG